MQYLVDAVIDSAEPTRHSPAKGQDRTTETKEAPTDDNGTFCRSILSFGSDPFVGKLVFFRVYSGCFRRATPSTITHEQARAHLAFDSDPSDKREDIETCYSGDIAAIVGIKNITTGDTLCDEDHVILLERPLSPIPLSRWRSSRDETGSGKNGNGLAAFVRRGSDFQGLHHEDTGQTIIAGMGELHLEIIRDRMFREFKVER